MNNGEMKRLGDYIREVDVRNRDFQRVHAIHCEHYWNGYVFL